MTALISAADLEARLGRDLTETEENRVDALLADVTAAVTAYTGQSFTTETTTQRVKIRGAGSEAFVILPQRPVSAVDTVEDMNGTTLPVWTWDEGDRVYLSRQVWSDFQWEPYRRPLNFVKVTYTHGHDSVPADVVGVAASMALRALGLDPLESSITQEAVDGYMYQRGSAGAAGGFGLLPDERAVLDRYRREFGNIRVAL